MSTGYNFPSSSGSVASATIPTWSLSKAYSAGNEVLYNNKIYYANGAVPSNTAFAIGTTGATWTAIGGGGTSSTITYQANSNSFPSSPAVGDQLIVTSNGSSSGALKEQWIYTSSGWYQLSGTTPVSGAVIDNTIADSSLIVIVGRYIVPASGTANLFVGNENKYADYDGTSFVFTTPANNNRVVITGGNNAGQTWLYSSSAWSQVISNALSVSAWVLANSYSATNLVIYNNTIYQANANIPANTPFVEGTTGATWKLVGAYNAPQFNPAALIFGAF